MGAASKKAAPHPREASVLNPPSQSKADSLQAREIINELW